MASKIKFQPQPKLGPQQQVLSFIEKNYKGPKRTHLINYYKNNPIS